MPRLFALLLATALLAGCAAEGGAVGPAPANPEPTKPVARENPPAASPESPPPDRTAAAVPAKEKAPGLPAARITRVVDGDTIHVALNGRDETVRLIGVDTPETVHPEKPVEPYGPEASAFTKSRLNGKTVYLEFDVQERDKYGRLLAYVWLDEPGEITDVFNAVLLLEGYAQLLTVPPNVKYADHFVRYQREAREAGKGLWGLEVVTQNQTGAKTNAQQTPAQSNDPKQVVQSSGGVQGTGGYDCPEDYPVKGNINSKGEKIYHVPGGQFYEKTKPEMCFKTPGDAEKAGFRASKR